MNPPVKLADGELYAGLLLGKDGEPDQHIVLLPPEAIDLDWNVAADWATATGGDLPSLRELALLRANLPEQFKPDWYWSKEENSPSCGFGQLFIQGSQIHGLKGFPGRARAVRRVPLLECAA